MQRPVTEETSLKIVPALLVAFWISSSAASVSAPVSRSDPTVSKTAYEEPAPVLNESGQNEHAGHLSNTADSTNDSVTDPSTDARTRQQKRNTIILSMFVAGIALTGLLLVIVAIVVRGFLRKMARQSAAKRQAELALPPDVAAAAAAASADNNVDESTPFSERETEVT